ncbi:MAG: TonB-dependent receptor [Parabacteroides sp.]|nr:TonB-dependent receptor [Parabacteroides sp.]
MKRLQAVLIFAGLCATAWLQAQHRHEDYTNFADTTFHIGEVTVQAQKKAAVEMLKLPAPLKYLPISMNKIDAGTLEMRGIRNIEQVARFLPGVRMQTSYGAFQQLSIRGFDYAPVVIDGVRDERSTINNSYTFRDLSSAESVELLKGPSSILFGNAAVGGVINVVRKAPAEQTSVNARVSYGSFDNKQATVGMGGKLIGPVNYLANFNLADQDGWRDNATKRFSGYLALGAQLTPNDRLEARAGFNRDFYSTEIGLPDAMDADIYNADGSLYLNKGDMLPGLNRKSRYNNESDFLKNRSYDVSAKYIHTFGPDMKLTDNLSYSYDDINYFGTEDIDYLRTDDPVYAHYYIKDNRKKYICLDSVQLVSPLRFSHIAKTVNNQLDLSGTFRIGEVSNKYVAGYSFTALNRNSYTGYTLGADVQGPGLYSKVPVNNPQSMGYMSSSFSKVYVSHTYMNALYLQDLVEINDQWKLMLAGRYDFYRYMQAVGTTPTGKREYDEHGAYQQIRNSAFTYRAGAVYLPHPSLSLYASFASFFTPIRTFYSANTIYIDSKGDEFRPDENKEVFEPETGYQAEAGAKYTFNRVLQANASVFYIRRNNSTQTLGTIPATETVQEKTITGQVGSMDSKGFDLECIVTPLPALSLTAGYGFTDARVRHMSTANDPQYAGYLTGGLNTNSGHYQTRVPRNTFYGYGNYTVPKGVFKNLGFLLSVSYTDKVYRDLANTKTYDSYWLTDLGAFYELKSHIRFTVNVNNLFDCRYFNQSLGDQMVPGMPRNFEVAVSYNL